MQVCSTLIYLLAGPMTLSEVGDQNLGPCCQAPGQWDQTVLISNQWNQNTKCCVRICHIPFQWLVNIYDKLLLKQPSHLDSVTVSDNPESIRVEPDATQLAVPTEQEPKP